MHFTGREDMYQFRTDVLSVALIAGGAAFAVGATLLLASSGTQTAEANECSQVMSHAQIDQRVVVSVGGDANAFVVTPGMTGKAEECAPVLHLADMTGERVRAQVQEAVARAEKAQVRARERVNFGREFDGETLVINLDGMEDLTIDMRGLEAEMEELGRELEREFGELERELELEMRDLGRELEAEFGDLERDVGDAEWEELSSEERDQIERRVEEAMRSLTDRLSRIGDRPSGGSF